uniref:Reverse transcriptase domain-containing protein n=1 Tax=Tanacetum cinerariifolium TaxID=118510 RepID=A0A6L2L2H8_TANCI|nr:hypothetical protein [Tanacetum cinerariifolium]
MSETMEQYMSMTRTDYGSRVARPKIDNKDQFELKGQFLKELQENTFSGSDHEDAKERIEKVLEIAIQEMVELSQKCHNGTSKGISTETSDGLATIQAQLNNLGREIKKVNEKVYASQEKDPRSFTLPCFINNVCFDNALVDLGASVSVMPLSTYLNLGLGELTHTKLTMELADRTSKYPKGIAENVLVGIRKFTFLLDFIFLDMPEDINVPLILRRPFLSTARAKIDVYKRKITLKVRKENIIFKSGKPTRSLIKRVYMLSFRERMELDLEARNDYHYNCNNEVTYQMVRSHLRFKCHTNEQCNKILPLLKVSEEDAMNGISHAYQKLKGFYKGVLNLGPDYIQHAKMEEWLTRGHISVHEMES